MTKSSHCLSKHFPLPAAVILHGLVTTAHYYVVLVALDQLLRRGFNFLYHLIVISAVTDSWEMRGSVYIAFYYIVNIVAFII